MSITAVTGADGMLGTELVRAASERGEELVAWTRRDFDLCDEAAVRREVAAARPRAVIHAAAWADVDGCEADPEKAFRVNGRGTSHLVEACRDCGTRVVFVSTDYVFPGDEEGPRAESDPPGPLSVYGWSKLVGEETVHTLGPRGVVARTAWVYADHGSNFLLTMLHLGRQRDEVAVVDDQVGSPTFAFDLARGLLDLAASDAAGTFHVTNRGSVSWHGFAERIFERAGMPVRVRAVGSGEVPRPAKRPANSVLGDARLAAAGVEPLPTWDEGLEACLRRLVPCA